MRLIPICLATLVAFTLAGCGDSDKGPEQQAPAPQAAAGSASVPQTTTGQLLVNIIPDPPTADGCLKALVSGNAVTSYLWEINGTVVEGQTSQQLCEGLRSGDAVRVTVNDGKHSGSVSVVLANAPPRITAVSVNDEGIARHADLVVKAETIDIDGDYVELQYQWYVNEETSPALSSNTLAANQYVRGDKIRFSITPSDGRSEGVPYQSATLVVPNASPQILSQPPEQFAAYEYTYQVKAMDPDGDTLTYTLEKGPAGMTIDQATGLVTWPLTGVKPGVYELRIVVSDPSGVFAFQEYSMTLGTASSAVAPEAKQ